MTSDILFEVMFSTYHKSNRQLLVVNVDMTNYNYGPSSSAWSLPGILTPSSGSLLSAPSHQL